MTPTPNPPPAAPLTAEQIAAIGCRADAYARTSFTKEKGDEARQLILRDIPALIASHAALAHRLARAETTIYDLRAHIAEHGPLFECRGQTIEEQRIALAWAEARCGELTEAVREWRTAFGTQQRAKLRNEVVTPQMEYALYSASVDLHDAFATPTDGAARAGDAAEGEGAE